MSEVNNNEPEQIDLSVQVDATQIDSIPIDTTLTHAGEAADAKATGDAIALKTSLTEVSNTFTVNSQGFDSSHNIELYGSAIDMSATDDTKVADAIAYLQETVEALAEKTADDIVYEDDESIKDAIDGLKTDVAGLQTKTGSAIKLSDSVNTTIVEAYNALSDRVTAEEGRTAEDILMTDDDDEERTVASEIARVNAKTGEDILLTDDDESPSVADAVTGKVDMDDIVNDLVTNDTEKPLSAAQGVVVKGLIDGLQSGKMNAGIVITPDNLRSYSLWTSGMTTLGLIGALPTKCIFQTMLQGGTPVELSDFAEDMDKQGTLFIMKSSSSYAGCLFFPRKSSDTYWYFTMSASDRGAWYRYSQLDDGLVKTVNGVAGDEEGNVDLGYISDADIDALFVE